jgi:signal transduction histidine kinase
VSATTAAENVRRQRLAFRPYALLVLVVVVLTSHPGFRDAAPLAVFAAGMAVVLRERAIAPAIAAMAAATVALALLEPSAAGPQIAGGAVVWLAVIRYGSPRGVAFAAVTMAALIAAVTVRDHAGVAVSILLFDTLMAVVAQFVRATRLNEQRMERLLEELGAAREELQAEAAVAVERGRIARELHDVLAHALSGAAIQLQGARVLAERAGAADEVRGAIDKASVLVREGLVSARDAVGALRGDALPGVSDLPALVEGSGTLAIEGERRSLEPDTELALYRAAQEAITNARKHAPGEAADLRLSFRDGETVLTVTNAAPADPVAAPGAGLGLQGMRERLELAGGHLAAGGTAEGFTVEAAVPA